MKEEDEINHLLTFGKFAGRTFGEIGSKEDGLKYLMWLRRSYEEREVCRYLLLKYLGRKDVADAVREIDRARIRKLIKHSRKKKGEDASDRETPEEDLFA